MTSSKPYLLRAIYQWLVDNRLTPYIMVDAEVPAVLVPNQFIEDGKIVLNVAPQAIGSLSLGNESIEFDASFSGVITHIYIPIKAIMAIYSYENGKGMAFEGDEDMDEGDEGEGGDEPPPPHDEPPAKGRPFLKIVK